MYDNYSIENGVLALYLMYIYFSLKSISSILVLIEHGCSLALPKIYPYLNGLSIVL